MAQAIPRENVLSALKRRYDHQSAEVVLKRAVEAAKLNDKEQYTTEELRSIGQGLQKVGDRLDSVLGELMALTERKPGASAAAASPQTRQASAPIAAATSPSAPVKADDVASPEATPAPTTLREAVGVAASATASDVTTTAAADSATADSASDEASAESSGEGDSSETETGETKSRAGRRRK